MIEQIGVLVWVCIVSWKDSAVYIISPSVSTKLNGLLLIPVNTVWTTHPYLWRVQLLSHLLTFSKHKLPTLLLVLENKYFIQAKLSRFTSNFNLSSWTIGAMFWINWIQKLRRNSETLKMLRRIWKHSAPQVINLACPVPKCYWTVCFMLEIDFFSFRELVNLISFRHVISVVVKCSNNCRRILARVNSNEVCRADCLWHRASFIDTLNWFEIVIKSTEPFCL